MNFFNFYVKTTYGKYNLKNIYPGTLRLGVSARNIYCIFKFAVTLFWFQNDKVVHGRVKNTKFVPPILNITAFMGIIRGA